MKCLNLKSIESLRLSSNPIWGFGAVLSMQWMRITKVYYKVIVSTLSALSDKVFTQKGFSNRKLSFDVNGPHSVFSLAISCCAYIRSRSGWIPGIKFEVSNQFCISCGWNSEMSMSKVENGCAGWKILASKQSHFCRGETWLKRSGRLTTKRICWNSFVEFEMQIGCSPHKKINTLQVDMGEGSSPKRQFLFAYW